MTQGFYIHRKSVCYGSYDETQVSGRRSAVTVKPEHYRTDRRMAPEDWAVHFHDNHRLLEPELEDLLAVLAKAKAFAPLGGEPSPDFTETENRLGVPLPRELKAIYEAICGHSCYFTGAERFLPPEELYEDSGVIVFYSKKKTPAAGYDIESGRLARYYKRSWDIDRGDLSVCRFCAGRVITAALSGKPAVREGRCKGRFVSTLSIERELLPLCGEKYHLLTELDIFGIAVMYSEDGTVAWIRSSCSFADIHAGAPEGSLLDELAECLGEEVAWK